MNADRIIGRWKQLRGKVKERWGKLTDDDLDVIRGKWDQLVGRIQETYGVLREKAEQQVAEFKTRWSKATARTPRPRRTTVTVRVVRRARPSSKPRHVRPKARRRGQAGR